MDDQSGPDDGLREEKGRAQRGALEITFASRRRSLGVPLHNGGHFYAFPT
jgi:hypothetical protein